MISDFTGVDIDAIVDNSPELQSEIDRGTITIDEFYQAISDILEGYSHEVTEIVKKNVTEVANGVSKVVASHIDFRDKNGKYRKAFRVKTTYENNLNKRMTWYVATPYYRLTHLLEYGHDIWNGGRARAFPHIQFGEEWARQRMEELTEKGIRAIRM